MEEFRLMYFSLARSSRDFLLGCFHLIAFEFFNRGGGGLSICTNHLDRKLLAEDFIPYGVGDLAFLDEFFPPSDFFRSVALGGCFGAQSLFVVGSTFSTEASLSAAFFFLSANIFWNLVNTASELIYVSSAFESDRLEIEACSPSESIG